MRIILKNQYMSLSAKPQGWALLLFSLGLLFCANTGFAQSLQFTPGTGNYNNPITVTLGYPAPGAQIYYRLQSPNAGDCVNNTYPGVGAQNQAESYTYSVGVDATGRPIYNTWYNNFVSEAGNWQVYNGPFTVDGNWAGQSGLILHVNMVLTNFAPIVTNYSISFSTANLTQNLTGTNALCSGSATFTASCGTSNAITIGIATLPGGSVVTRPYTGPIVLTNKSYLTVSAGKTNYNNYQQNKVVVVCNTQTPISVTPSSQVQNNAINVTLGAVTGAKIYYRLQTDQNSYLGLDGIAGANFTSDAYPSIGGGDPNTSYYVGLDQYNYPIYHTVGYALAGAANGWTLYNGAFTIDGNWTGRSNVVLHIYEDGGQFEAPQIANYTYTFNVAPLSVTPSGNVSFCSGSTNISVSCATIGAVSTTQTTVPNDPAPTHPTVSGGIITLTNRAYLAITAQKTNYNNPQSIQVNAQCSTATPISATPASSTQNNAVSIALNATAGSKIYYRLQTDQNSYLGLDGIAGANFTADTYPNIGGGDPSVSYYVGLDQYGYPIFHTVGFALAGAANGWTLYTGPVTVDGNWTGRSSVVLHVYEDGGAYEPPQTTNYTYTFNVAPLVVTPNGNVSFCSGSTNISVSCATTGAVTTTQTTIPNDPAPTHPLVVGGNITLTNRAYLAITAQKANYNNTQTSQVNAQCSTATPVTINPANATQNNPINVTIGAVAGAKIYYRLQTDQNSYLGLDGIAGANFTADTYPDIGGGDSSTSYYVGLDQYGYPIFHTVGFALAGAANGWTLYTGPVTVDGNWTGRSSVVLHVYEDGGAYEPPQTTNLTYTFNVAPMVVTPAGNNNLCNGSASITASCGTTGAVHYTEQHDLNGATSAGIYSGPMTVTNRSYYTFTASKANYNNTQTTNSTFSCNATTPVSVSPALFTNTGPATVTLSAANGAKIYYRLQTDQNSYLGLDGIAGANFNLDTYPNVGGGDANTSYFVGLDQYSYPIYHTIGYALAGAANGWALYSGPISIDGNWNGRSSVVLHIYEDGGQFEPPQTTNFTYVFNVAPLTTTPAGTNIFCGGSTTLSMSCATPGSVTYTEQASPSAPVTSGNYSSPLTITNRSYFHVTAARANYNNTQTANVSFVCDTSTPLAIAPNTSSNINPATITITGPTGAHLYYRLQTDAGVGGAVNLTDDVYPNIVGVDQAYSYFNGYDQYNYPIFTTWAQNLASSANSWSQYSGPITIDGNWTGRSVVVLHIYSDGGLYEAPGVTNYTLSFSVAPMSVTPTGTISLCSGSTNVTVACATLGAVHFNLQHDLSGATTSGSYSGPITVTNRSYYTFTASRPNYNNNAQSAVANFMCLDSGNLSVSANSGTYYNPIIATISGLAGSHIYYRLQNPNGSGGVVSLVNDIYPNIVGVDQGYTYFIGVDQYNYPQYQSWAANLATSANTWSTYSGPITIDGNWSGQSTVILHVYSDGGSVGAPQITNMVYNFTIGGITLDPTNISVASASSPISVSATSLTSNLQYSVSSKNQAGSYQTYTGPVILTNRQFAYFKAQRNNYNNSPQTATISTIGQLEAPVFIPASGSTFGNQTRITVETQTPTLDTNSLVFQMTTNWGSTLVGFPYIDSRGWPAQDYIIYGSGSYTASVSGIGSNSQWLASPTSSATYQFQVTELVTTPSQNFYTNLTVSAKSSLTGTTYPALYIYYTTDGSLPTTNSPPYSGPFTINTNTTVTWLGVRGNYTPAIITNTYSIAPKPTTPQLVFTGGASWGDPVILSASTGNTNDIITYSIVNSSRSTYYSPSYVGKTGTINGSISLPYGTYAVTATATSSGYQFPSLPATATFTAKMHTPVITSTPGSSQINVQTFDPGFVFLTDPAGKVLALTQTPSATNHVFTVTNTGNYSARVAWWDNCVPTTTNGIYLENGQFDASHDMTDSDSLSYSVTRASAPQVSLTGGANWGDPLVLHVTPANTNDTVVYTIQASSRGQYYNPAYTGLSGVITTNISFPYGSYTISVAESSSAAVLPGIATSVKFTAKMKAPTIAGVVGAGQLQIQSYDPGYVSVVGPSGQPIPLTQDPSTSLRTFNITQSGNYTLKNVWWRNASVSSTNGIYMENLANFITGSDMTDSDANVLNVPNAAAPSISPAGGTFTNDIVITVTPFNPTDTIRYSTATPGNAFTFFQPMANNVVTLPLNNYSLGVMAQGAATLGSIVISNSYTAKFPQPAYYMSGNSLVVNDAYVGTFVLIGPDGTSQSWNNAAWVNSKYQNTTKPLTALGNYNLYITNSNWQASDPVTITIAQASSPSISPAGGTITGGNQLNITITPADPNDTVYYSLTGTNGTFQALPGPLLQLPFGSYSVAAYEQSQTELASPKVVQTYLAKLPQPTFTIQPNGSLLATSAFPGTFILTGPGGATNQWASTTWSNGLASAVTPVMFTPGTYTLVENLPNWLSSDPISLTLSQTAPPSVTPSSGVISGFGNIIVAASAEAGATVYYSTNAANTGITHAYLPMGADNSISLTGQGYTIGLYAVAPGKLPSQTVVRSYSKQVSAGGTGSNTGSNTNGNGVILLGGGTTASTTNSGVQIAQNPDQTWEFQQIPVVEDTNTEQNLSQPIWLQKNQQYLLRMNAQHGSYEFVSQLRTLPSNDTFTNAIVQNFVLTNGQSISVSSTNYNIYASSEPGEVQTVKGQTVWYAVTTTVDGTFTFEADPYNGDPVMIQDGGYGVGNWTTLNFPLSAPSITVFQGTNLSDLTLITDSRIINTNSSVNPYIYPSSVSCFMLKSNQYFIRVDATAAPGEFLLTKSFDPRSPNDNIKNAILLTSKLNNYDNGLIYTYSQLGQNFDATSEAGEPLDQPNSVWFKIYTPVDGYLQASVGPTTGSSSGATNHLFIYAPANSAAITNISVMNVVRQSSGTFYPAGSLIYLCVYGDQNIFTVAASCTTPPYNDYSTNAQTLPTAAFKSVRSTFNYFSKADEMVDDNILGVDNSLWWTASPNLSGTLIVRSLDGTFPSTYWKLVGTNAVAATDTTTNQQVFHLNTLNTYLFRMAVADQYVGIDHLLFEYDADPANDTAQTAMPLSQYVGDTYANGTVYRYSLVGIDNGTTQPGEPFAHSVWYSWQAPAAGYATFNVSSTMVNYKLYENNQAIIAPVTCNTGDTVLMAVGGDIDSYSLTGDFRNTPSNDEPTNAIALVTGQDFRFYTKYATMTGTNTDGAADLWCTYDPIANQPAAAFYITPATNGLPVTMIISQAGVVVANRTFTNVNEQPLNITFDPTNLVTLRFVVQNPDTDFTVLASGQANNDNFADAATITLHPQIETIATPNGNVQMLKYSSHIVANNIDATTQPHEPVSSISLHDPTQLAGKSLWWKITTPISGTFSIRSRNGPNAAKLDYQITTLDQLPTSIYDFYAWNSITSIYQVEYNSQIVSYGSGAGLTYYIRIDTALEDVLKSMDFDVSMIPFPVNDFAQQPAVLANNSTVSTLVFDSIYPLITAASKAKYDGVGTIYGGTREVFMQNTWEKTDYTALRLAGLLPPNYPAYQSVYYQFNPVNDVVLVLSTNYCNFNPVFVVTAGDPAAINGGAFSLLNPGTPTVFRANNTYTILVDALVSTNDVYSGGKLFGNDIYEGLRAVDFPVNVGAQGWNSDFNRDCADSIPGVISFTLASDNMLPNDSIQTPYPLVLQPGHLGASFCSDPAGHWVARIAEDNSTATSELDTNLMVADHMGGAGKTIWFSLTPAMTSDLTLDFSDSLVPVNVKVFQGGNFHYPGSLYNGPIVKFSAMGNTPYLIGVDSLAGNAGVIALTAYQSLSHPVNDNFNGAIELTTPSTCGSLQNSTIEPGESSVGTGSIWYKIHNYTTTNISFVFTLSASSSQEMEIYQSLGSLSSSLLRLGGATNLTYSASAGEVDYIRVYDTNSTPTGNISLSLTAPNSWYQSMMYVTPSTTFLGSLPVWAYSLSSVTPTIYYSTTGTATTASQQFPGNMVITNTTQFSFLISYPGDAPFLVSRTYTAMPSVAVTPSQTYSGVLSITASNIPTGAFITYARGDSNGNVATAPNYQPFPANGLTIADSAQFNFQLYQAAGTPILFYRQYTATVNAPVFAANGDGSVAITETTPSASIQVYDGNQSYTFNTNSITYMPSNPNIYATGVRPGWAASTNWYTTQPIATNLIPITLTATNTAANSVQITMANQNPGTYIWYSITNATGVITTNGTGPITLNLPYSGTITAFAGNNAQTIISPSVSAQFTATLLAPAIKASGSSLIFSNANQIASTMYVNGIPVGTNSTWSMTYVSGVQLFTFAQSPIANTSPTNAYVPGSNTNLSVNPSSTTFSSPVTVTIQAAAGNRLLITTISVNGSSTQLIPANITQLTIDKTTTVIAQALVTDVPVASLTNTYTAKVAPVQITAPATITGGFDTYTPAYLSCATPGVQYQYQYDNGAIWYSLNDNLMSIYAGTHTYTIRATKAGWVNSDSTTVSYTGITPANALVNYVGRNYTILPSTPANIPAVITATNSLLVDNYPITYRNFVWTDADTTPQEALYVFSPVSNLKVYHQVFQYTDNAITASGPVLFDYVNVALFDFRVENPSGSSNAVNLVVSDDPNVYNNVYFYEPTWIQTSTAGMVLEAVSGNVAYDLTPLSKNNQTEYLIPGNLNPTTDHLTLRYHSPIETGVWHQFQMKFRTLAPSQYKDPASSITAPAIVVVIAQDYQNQDIGAYYTDSTLTPSPNLTQPLPYSILLTNLSGTVTNISLRTTNDMYWINSKLGVINLTNYINTYNGLPVVPLDKY